jgi:S1-C subfamily serine protease
MDEKKYFVKQGRQRIGPFSYEELFNQNIDYNTFVWVTGAPKWRKLKDIPELTEIYNSLPPGSRSSIIWLWALVLLIILGLSGYLGYTYFLKNQGEKQMSNEELIQAYSSSVFLIRHDFLYRMNVSNENYYFNSFNSETGEISEFMTLEEANEKPITSWGTGFLIDSLGRILTCDHVVDTRPTEKEVKLIKDYLVNSHNTKIAALILKREDLASRYRSVSWNSQYESYDDYYDRLLAVRDELNDMTDQINLSQKLVNDLSSTSTIITKKTLKFGIFRNGQSSTNFKDAIMCKSIKLSDDSNIDLAIVTPIDGPSALIAVNPVKLSRILNAEKGLLRMDETIRMIGYNDGELLANTSTGVRPQITEGKVTQNSDQFKILYSIAALPGSSGSPIFDEFGNLVSVNFAGRMNSQSFNYGVNINQIANFIK